MRVTGELREEWAGRLVRRRRIALPKVTSKLENSQINYIVIDRRNNYDVDLKEDYKNLNKYDKYYEKANKIIFVLGRAVIVAAPAGIVIWLFANINIGNINILTYIASFLDPLRKNNGARWIHINSIFTRFTSK